MLQLFADGSLDPITAVVTNLGGPAAVAGLMFYLLRGQLQSSADERKQMLADAHQERKDTLDAFRSELAAERKVYTEGAEARHAELMTRLSAVAPKGDAK